MTTPKQATVSKPSKAVKASKAKRKAVSSRKASKAGGKASKARRGGKALSDFGNNAKLKVLKASELNGRKDCFRTGQTVAQNLAAQKAKGFKGRRKFIRVQIRLGRVSVSAK